MGRPSTPRQRGTPIRLETTHSHLARLPKSVDSADLAALRAAVVVGLASEAVRRVRRRHQDVQTHAPMTMQSQPAITVLDAVLPLVIHHGGAAGSAAPLPDAPRVRNVHELPVAADEEPTLGKALVDALIARVAGLSEGRAQQAVGGALAREVAPRSRLAPVHRRIALLADGEVALARVAGIVAPEVRPAAVPARAALALAHVLACRAGAAIAEIAEVAFDVTLAAGDPAGPLDAFLRGGAFEADLACGCGGDEGSYGECEGEE